MNKNMNDKLNIVLIGGDLRQVYLARILSNDGHTTTIYGAEKTETEFVKHINSLDGINADCIILPLPLFAENEHINAPLSSKKITLNEVLEAVPSYVPLLGGKIPADTIDMASLHGYTLIDYLEREELAVANAVPTAEGACALAMEELPITLRDAKTLVVGYGRCGKILSNRLHAFGCDLTVSARKCADFAWIEAYGYTGIATSNIYESASEYDLIFNTVPSLVLDKNVLKKLKKECLVIDLASKPGGVDFEAAQQLGVNVIWALSLPGKLSPQSSGRIIRNTIYNILQERGADCM